MLLGPECILTYMVFRFILFLTLSACSINLISAIAQMNQVRRMEDQVTFDTARIDYLEHRDEKHEASLEKLSLLNNNLTERLTRIEAQNDVILKLVFAIISAMGGGTLLGAHQIRKVRSNIDKVYEILEGSGASEESREESPRSVHRSGSKKERG